MSELLIWQRRDIALFTCVTAAVVFAFGSAWGGAWADYGVLLPYLFLVPFLWEATIWRISSKFDKAVKAAKDAAGEKRGQYDDAGQHDAEVVAADLDLLRLELKRDFDDRLAAVVSDLRQVTHTQVSHV